MFRRPHDPHRPRITLKPHKSSYSAGAKSTKLSDDEIKTIESLPRVLAIQKKKLLIAINKTNDEPAGSFSPEEEQLVENVTKSLTVCNLSSQQWDDAEAIQLVKKTLQNHAIFELSKYLDYASYVCESFSSIKCASTDSLTTAMNYVLAHARQFGDPTKTIFQIETTANQVTTSRVNSARPVCPISQQTSQSSNIVNRAKDLIVELKKAYDETKFRALNAQVTSFVLLILRRIMKQGITVIHSNSHRTSICLVIDAYLNSDDEKTKKNLRDSCIKYMEWYDMQLPGMFFKIADLYGMEVSELWDCISSIKSRKINKSLIDLATEYYKNYQLSKDNPLKSQRWFAYSRIFKTNFHSQLSNKANICICAVFDKLIDKKNPHVDPAYKYTCPDNADHVTEWAEPIAAEVYAGFITA